MRDGEEEDGEGGDQEVIEADLLRTVDVRCLVDVRKDTDGIFRNCGYRLSVALVFHYARCGMQNRTVDEDAHLVCPEVQYDSKTLYGTGCGLRFLASTWMAVSQRVWDRRMPLYDLIVEISNVLFAYVYPCTIDVANRSPNFGSNLTVSDHCC